MQLVKIETSDDQMIVLDIHQFNRRDGSQSEYKNSRQLLHTSIPVYSTNNQIFQSTTPPVLLEIMLFLFLRPHPAVRKEARLLEYMLLTCLARNKNIRLNQKHKKQETRDIKTRASCYKYARLPNPNSHQRLAE